MPTVIRPATPADRAAVLRLFASAFGTPADPAGWEWKYDRNPRPALSVVAMDGADAVGYFGSIGTRYRGASGNLPGTASGDVMTLPAARALGRRGLFKELGDTFRRLNAERGIPFDFGFPHERARLIEERLLGCRTVERAGLLARPVASAGLARRLRLRLSPPRRDEPFGSAHEALAAGLHAREGWRTDRSGDVLAWRLARPGVRYTTLQLVDRRARSRGYAVLRNVAERALLVDLQVADEGGSALGDLLAAASETAARDGMRVLELRAPRNGSLARRLRGEFGFADGESDTHFFIRPFDPAFDLDRAASLFDYRYLDHDVF